MTGLIRTFLIVIAVLTMAAAYSGPPRDPLEGAWKLNLDKSNFRSPAPPKGQLRTYRLAGEIEHMTSRGLTAEGRPSLVRYDAKYDGGDYDITGSAGGDKIALRRIDAQTTESTQKRDGKAVIVATRRVSPDGRVLTVTTHGTLPDGQKVDAVMVFEKQ